MGDQLRGPFLPLTPEPFGGLGGRPGLQPEGVGLFGHPVRVDVRRDRRGVGAGTGRVVGGIEERERLVLHRDDLDQALRLYGIYAVAYDRRTGHPADQGVGGAGGDAEQRRDQAPGDGGKQCGHYGCHRVGAGLYYFVADGGRHGDAKEKGANEMGDCAEHQGASWTHGARRDHGGDDVGAVVKAVQKVERQGCGYENDQY